MKGLGWVLFTNARGKYQRDATTMDVSSDCATDGKVEHMYDTIMESILFASKITVR
jgi:hypothetical protein